MSKYDWPAIQKEYIADQLSNCEISRKYGAPESSIRYRAKKYNWKKTLGKKVREQVREKLLREDLRESNINDNEVIDHAAERGKNVVLSQRRDIKKLRDLEEKLLAELHDNPTKLYMAQYQGEVIHKEVGIPVTEKSQALNNLANVQHKRIQLERQAFNLDEQGGGDDDSRKIEVEFVKP